MLQLWFEFELWLFGDRRQRGRSERSERREWSSFKRACMCVCARAHIGARKIVSKILKMRCYRSFPIGNRTAVLLYCLFYLPKISVVYCH